MCEALESLAAAKAAAEGLPEAPPVTEDHSEAFYKATTAGLRVEPTGIQPVRASAIDRKPLARPRPFPQFPGPDVPLRPPRHHS